MLRNSSQVKTADVHRGLTRPFESKVKNYLVDNLSLTPKIRYDFVYVHRFLTAPPCEHYFSQLHPRFRAGDFATHDDSSRQRLQLLERLLQPDPDELASGADAMLFKELLEGGFQPPSVD